MAVPLWEKGETREPLKSFCSLSSIILRIPHGLCSQGAESKTNTAQLNQDGDLIGNKKYDQDNETMAFRTVGPHTTFKDEVPHYLFPYQANSATETAQQTMSWYQILRNAK